MQVTGDALIGPQESRRWSGVIRANEESRTMQMLDLWTAAPNDTQGETWGFRFKTDDGRGLIVHGAWTECDIIAGEDGTVAKLGFAFDRWREW